ncbi:MAG: hypothetical protein CM1200mP26_20200 [Acidimicrobiales bacterium]|nr:MAG: hypothetical protein CM1200mP26_20200 [Acidimicrobiales bacterium]
MGNIVEGRVAVVTGAGRGIGREHALMLAENGAKVVVNDLGGDAAGGGADTTPAQTVVDEIVAMGGEAVVNGANVADFDAAGSMIQQAIDTFGSCDILINNAGILRDRMMFSMTESDWDAVIKRAPEGHLRSQSTTRRSTGARRSRQAVRHSDGSSTRRLRRASTATSDSPTTAQPRPASPRSPSSRPWSWSSTA